MSVVANLLPLVLALAFAAAPKPGVERWPIKTSLAPNADLGRPVTLSFDDFARLPDPPDAKKRNPNRQSVLYPKAPGANVAEGDIVSLTGWLRLVAAESDGDYHIQITKNATDKTGCIIVEVPMPNPKFVKDVKVRTAANTVRSWVKSSCLKRKNPLPSGTMLKHPVQVVVAGQLFYDDAHVGDPPRGKKGMKALTLWEIHPVTTIYRASQ